MFNSQSRINRLVIIALSETVISGFAASPLLLGTTASSIISNVRVAHLQELCQ
jgi:hypothetical protein